MGKRNKENNTFLRKKTEEKKYSATIIISVNGKREVFAVKWKLQTESFE